MVAESGKENIKELWLMNDDGYIKISRKILEWEWYDDMNTKSLFLHLLLKATYKDKRYMGEIIPRGSYASSIRNLADETGMSVQNIRTSLKRLEVTQEVTRFQHGKFTVFTVNNYDKYQTGNTVPNTEVTQSQHRGNTLIEQEIKNNIKESVSNDTDKKDDKRLSPSDSDSHIIATIQSLYGTVCGSYPRLAKMTEKRKAAIKARLRQGYTVDDFKTVFEKAEASSFLKGGNDRNWSADFDWLIKDTNMSKVLEGKYDHDRKPKQQPVGKPNKFNNFEQRKYDFADYERRLLQT